MQDSVTKPQWEEESSQDFIDYGKYFVPDREIQIDAICEVIPRPSKPAYILVSVVEQGSLRVRYWISSLNATFTV